jgi:hypothetical protein
MAQAKTKPVPAKKKAAPPLKKPSAKPAPKAATLPLPKAPVRAAPLPSSQALPPRLQAVIDKSEISDILYSIARGIDRVDETMLRSAFHPEATVDMGPGLFQGTSGDYVHWIVGVLAQIRESHHMITNVRVAFEGDTALVESYCHAHFRLDKPTGREDVFLGSRYLDRLERKPAGVAGVWKIIHRKQIIDWTRTEAVSDLFYHQNPDALWSYRTKIDPSYQMAQFPGSQSGNKMPSFLGRRYESKSIKF